MSEYRHFLHEAGRVESYANPADRYYPPDEYTEVQVVPLDAIVIDRADLPKVAVDDDTIGAGSSSMGMDGNPLERGERYLLGMAAMVAFLREHPPVQVDEREVERLADALRETDNHPSWKATARALMGRGVRFEEASES